MPEVMQPCVRQLPAGADELGHQGRNSIGVDRLAPSGREHIAVLGPAPGVACLELFGGLVGLTLAQDGHGLVVDGDDAGPAALGRAVDALAADHGRGAGDGDLLAVEVDVLPSQVEQLAATCPGIGRDMEEREQAVLLRGGQEGPELGDGPDGAGSWAWTRGRLARSTGLLPINSSTMTASRN